MMLVTTPGVNQKEDLQTLTAFVSFCCLFPYSSPFYSSSMSSNRIVIASLARTPITKFGGSFKPLTATQLGARAIRGALDRVSDHDLPTVREVYMGNVVSAGLGQAPARQAVKGAGLPDGVSHVIIAYCVHLGRSLVVRPSLSPNTCHHLGLLDDLYDHQ